MKKYNISQVITLMGIFLYTIVAVASYSTITVSGSFGQTFLDIMRIACLVILSIQSLLNVKKGIQLLLLFIAVLISLFIFIITNNHEFFFIISVLLMFSTSNLTILSLIRCVRNAVLMAGVFIMVLALSGIITNIETIRQNSDIVRYSMGFTHPNVLGFIFLVITLLTLWIQWEATTKFINLFSILIIVFSIGIIIKLADSRTPILLLLILSIICVFLDKKIISIRKLRIIYFLSLGSSVILTIYFSIFYHYGNSVHLYLSRLLSGRLDLLHSFFQRYGFSFFGQNVSMTSSNTRAFFDSYYYLDSGYGRGLIEFGIFFTMIFLATCIVSVQLAYTMQNKGAIVYAIFVVLYLLLQDRLMVEPLWTTPLFVFLGQAILGKTQNSEEGYLYEKSSV